MESKKEIYDLMPKDLYPKTILVKPGEKYDSILHRLRDEGFVFPLLGKPDIGMRGMEVKKLNNEKDLLDYVERSKVDFLIQEFVPLPLEAGIFYYRMPGEKKGHISGIVYKEFLTIKGDGTSTILELLKKDKRSILQINALIKQHPDKLNEILPEVVDYILVPYGNHSRGSKFIDASYQIDEMLTDSIDKICKQVPGFYYGRMDIRFNSWEELKQGKNFSIIELNGAGSEPTHIYDPRHSIFFAWKEIIRHWNILYKISRGNRNQFHYMKFSEGVKMFRDNAAYLKQLNSEARA
jgi:hypothetical protein